MMGKLYGSAREPWAGQKRGKESIIGKAENTGSAGTDVVELTAPLMGETSRKERVLLEVHEKGTCERRETRRK